MVDDAGFDLVTMSEDVTAKSTDAITGLVLGGVRTLQVLLTLRADGNLAAGLLNEAANVPDPAALQPLRERFDAAASHAKKLLGQLSGPAAEGPLRSLTETLIGFGASTGNLFDLRREELRKVAAAQASLERSGSLLLQLGKEATDLVATAQSNSDEATLRLARAIRNGKLLLLLITAVSLAGAILIATRYVISQVVRPIERITRAMSGLAAGDTAIDVPGPAGWPRRSASFATRRSSFRRRTKVRFVKAAGNSRSRSKASLKHSRSMTARIIWSCATANTKRSFILAAASIYRPA